ncbi:MAG: tetratricopeptide repeat protein [Synergistetes bacterium]|nr:tetratricopeptide repeat protein [Synergistota bacterium]MCX8127253.1 tetratricopeptide repeat protein [Synergistota bacterium]MDW8191861.1 tetratricopeptide repeat protein [Synergistota bacterium]
MSIAFVFLLYYSFGHTRGLVEESLKVFNESDFSFYINSKQPIMVPSEVQRNRNIIYFSDFERIMEELTRRKDIDAIIIFDTIPDHIETLIKVKPCSKRIFLYNASVDILALNEKLRLLASKGYIFIWEHEVASYMAKKYVFSEGIYPVLTYPVPDYSDLCDSCLDYDLLFPGSFEERKGASVFLMVLPDLVKSGLRIRASLFGFDVNEWMILEFAKYDGKIYLKKEPDKSQEEFIRELLSSRIGFFPYDPYQYSLAGSGILKECMIYGIPVITTKGSFLSYYLERNNGSWVSLETRIDRDAIIETIYDAMRNYDSLRDKALKIRFNVKKECSSFSFKERLLNIVYGKVNEGELSLPEYLLSRAEAYFLYFKAGMLYRKSKFEEAEEYLDKALTIDCGYWRALFLKADLLSRKGEYIKAIEMIELAESNPLISPLNKGYALVKKAALFEKIGKTSLCINTLNSVKPLKPYLSTRCLDDLLEIKSVKLTDLLDSLFSDSLNYLDIVLPKLYKIVFLLKIFNIGVYIDRSVERIFSKLSEEIESLTPEDESLLETNFLGIRALFYNLIASLAVSEKKRYAQEALFLFIKLFGRLAVKDPLYTYNIASLYEKLGDLDKAEELFKEALDRDFYNKSGIYFHLAEIYLKRGRLREAVDFYSLCLSFESDHVLAAKRLEELGVKRNGI